MAMGNHRHFFCPEFNFSRESPKREVEAHFLSNRALLFSLIFLALFFGGVSYLIARPLPDVSQAESNPVIQIEDASQRAPASVDHRALVSEINTVIGEHPKMLGKKFTGSSPIGLNLGSPEEVTYFLSEEGKADFFSKFSETKNFEPFIEDLDQAWKQVGDEDLAKREVLLEISAGLLNFSQNERLKGHILGEFDRFNKASDRPEARDYAARALQGYLEHEQDPVKRSEELSRRGIPVLIMSPNKTNN